MRLLRKMKAQLIVSSKEFVENYKINVKQYSNKLNSTSKLEKKITNNKNIKRIWLLQQSNLSTLKVAE